MNQTEIVFNHRNSYIHILTTPDEALFMALESTRLFSWKSNTGINVSLPLIKSYFNIKPYFRMCKHKNNFTKVKIQDSTS